MLCSISTSRSSSNWLDRLHAAKGFSIPADLDLDHFLSSNPNPDPNFNSCFHPPPPPETRPSDARRKQHPSAPVSASGNKTAGEKEQIFDLMSSALAELFIMRDRSALGTQRRSNKSARKQPNPKACVPSVSASIGGNFLAGAPAACRVTPATSPSSAENSVAEAKKRRTKARRKRGTAGSPVESDLSTYSKTEVTIIDTSFPGWKSEKLIFRKGIVWKVRDKKKLWNVCRKKRKLGLVERLISENDKEQPLIDMKVSTGKEHSRSMDEGAAHAEKRDASNESDDQIQILIRKPKFSRSPSVPVAKDSSVYCLQFSTSRKNGLACPRGTPKG